MESWVSSSVSKWAEVGVSGNSMISMSDLEKLFDDACDRLNLQASNMNTMIDKAADAGLVIVDKSINYVRFRNRAMATGPIQYV